VLLQCEAKYSLCLNHLIIMTIVLKFYSFLISFFLWVMFTMLFFLILHMKFLYFFSSLKILSVLFTLYHKHSFFFMFKAFYKSFNVHSQLILIIINLTSFCCIIMNSYLLLCNIIHDWFVMNIDIKVHVMTAIYWSVWYIKLINKLESTIIWSKWAFIQLNNFTNDCIAR